MKPHFESAKFIIYFYVNYSIKAKKAKTNYTVDISEMTGITKNYISLRSGTIGFIAGSMIPILFTKFYILPVKQSRDEREINYLRNSLRVMDWQVKKLENGDPESQSKIDELYWAGF